MNALNLSLILGQVQRIVGETAVIQSFQVGQDEYIKCLERALSEVAKVAETCKILNLPMSEIAARRVIRELGSIPESVDYGLVDNFTVPKLLNTLVRTIRDETSLRLYFYLPEQSHKRYMDLYPFGELVLRLIPSAAYDVEESTKCLALERSTAAVFHVIRAVDMAVKSLLVSLDDAGYTKAERTWKDLIDRILTHAKKDDQAITPNWTGKQARLKEIGALLHHVRDATRNPTMHALSKYTLEEAEGIYNNTKAFMRRIATELDNQ